MTIIPEQNAASDRRGETRRKALKGGVLSFNKGYGALDCVVRDVSEHGARLRFGETHAVPGIFQIRIGERGEPRQAAVRWRSPTEIGVRLQDA